jgi:protein-export membrane protein SecD
VRRTRALWVSIGFVGLLVVASIGSFVLGTRPVLGLDLEGGVSVILQAPEGTSRDVMERALENIRTRVDAFGVGEPILYLSGTNIEVQIPGLARGEIQQRRHEQFCLIGEDAESFGCFDEEDAATKALESASVDRFVTSACLSGGPFDEDSPRCFATEKQANDALDAIAVEKQEDEFCLTGTGLEQDPCFPTRDEADDKLAQVTVDLREEYCLSGTEGATLEGETGPACFGSMDAAEEVLASISVRRLAQEFCVVSSAGRNLGCYLNRDDAESQLQETGQERLLQVIGTTARLEQRQVLEILAPGSPAYEATPVTCGEPTERDTQACSFEALRDQDVVFLGADGQTKYRLGPVEFTGEAIKRATAVYGSASQGQAPGWRIDFQLTPEGTETVADVTTRLVQQQLAIVVDEVVISAPTVQDPITGGAGVITGSFTKQRAQDLATQLNAGALPVNLQQQQVQTVSPTLGAESLRQAVWAGIGGLVLLALYLLFYYRLLGVVAWFGMAIWAILAISLVGVAGLAFGYSLTLAGVAGLVISLGVTADSYIVFFERLKDEVRNGRTPRSAVQPAFSRAFRTIIAADTVTAIAAIVLYVTAISSVRGFALTLGVSVVLDLFVVWFFKRPTAFLIARSERLVNLPGFGLTSGVAADRLPGEAAPVVAGASK